MRMYAKDNTKNLRRTLFTMPLLFLLFMAISFAKTAKAAEASITVKEINYQNSTITLQTNKEDQTIYFSDSQKKTWEAIPGKLSSNNTIVMDISWVTLTSNYVMNFKGDKSTEITSVVIPKQATSIKAAYNKLNGSVSFSNSGSRTIEWRKKDSTVWNTVNTGTIASELSNFYGKGATVYFRLAPINGTSNTDVGCRASKEVAVTIPKRIDAPKVTIDGSKFTLNVKKGVAYRTVNEDGTVTEWEVLRSANPLLTSITPDAMYSGNQTLQEEVTLQFRTNATSSSQVSNISSITIPVQEGPPDEDQYGIILSYTSSTTLSLQVKAANTEVPFEYTIIKKDNELEYQTASWNTISSGAPISINKSTAPLGSHIYIRKKSAAATEETDFKLASVEIDVTGTNGVTYADAPKATTLTTLITMAGVCNAENSSGHLAFTLYSPTQTTVSAIDFYDAYGIKKGSVTLKSSVSANNNSSTENDKYIITTRITSTESIDTITNERLFAYITLANSDKIISNGAAGIQLYLYPKSNINNLGHDNYSSDFKRVYQSDDQDDLRSFQFQLDFGTDKVIDPSEIDKYTTQVTAISSIQCKGYQLRENTDYTIVYGSYQDDDKKTVATATVTVNVAEFENSIPKSNLDQKIPLVIKLNNNEVLDKNINMTLVSTATIENIPIAWSITEGSLKETKTSTVTNPDGTTSTVTEEVITYTINLKLFDNAYGVGISDVTWGDTSVMGSANVTAGKATIYLSNAKINKLTTSSTDTKNIVITLSNGFVINSGCKLTIIKAH